MRRRALAHVYQLIARVWLTAAALAFFLPSDRRLGLWLPLHLALAGAVSIAIGGAMQAFAAALTAAPDPPRALPVSQALLVNAGAALIAIGYPMHRPALVATGGVTFGAGMLLLAYVVARFWRRSINKRHPVPMLAYGFALASILSGVVVGALIGSNAVTGDAWLALRSVHMIANVLGWATLTIVGTLLTLIPTLLRVRIPAWRPMPVVAAVALGVTCVALGVALDVRALASAGAVVLAIGAFGVVWLMTRVMRLPRRLPIPIAARHILAGVLWFVGGTIALAWTLVASPSGTVAGTFTSFRDTFVVAFVAGWVLQVLLGAWLYLLPAQRPATPNARKRLLGGVELGGSVHLAALNAGLALLALDVWTAAGAGLAAAGAAVALAKAWLYPSLARLPAAQRKGESFVMPAA